MENNRKPWQPRLIVKAPRARKHKSRLCQFLTIVGVVVGSFIIVSGLVAFAYLRIATAAAKPYQEHLAMTAQREMEEETAEIADDESTDPLWTSRKTNFLIMGIDDEASLSDVSIVGCFDNVTEKIDLINIPRDTYITLSRENIQALQQAGRRPPASGVMKMNAVHSYAGKELGAQYMQKAVEELLGIKIDYYAEVNTAAFRNIVDAVDGVDMEIPKGGLYYNDPIQNLTINVPGGQQHLTGKMAEGVVRYRATYPGGDLQRITVQQTFLKELFKQVLDKDTIMSNAPAFIGTVISYVKTNFGLTDVPKYLKYIDSLRADNLNMQVLPGSAKSVLVGSEYVSYYFHDEAETQKLVQRIFFSLSDTDEADDEHFAKQWRRNPLPLSTTIDSDEQSPGTAPALETPAPAPKDFNIQILNGGITQGLAAKKRAMLEEEGFTVTNIDTYTGTQKHETRIMARDTALAERIADYFTGVVVEQDDHLPDQYDVIVILGLDEM